MSGGEFRTSLSQLRECLATLVGTRVRIPKSCFAVDGEPEPQLLSKLPDVPEFDVVGVDTTNDDPKKWGLRLQALDHREELVLKGGDRKSKIICPTKRLVSLAEILLRNDVVLPRNTRDSFLHEPRDRTDDDEEKSMRFAKVTARILERLPDGLAMVMDGEGRNVRSLLAVGVPASRIVVMECVAEQALYHRLAFPAVVAVFTNTGAGNTFPQRQNIGFFEHVLMQQRQSVHLPMNLMQRIVAVYADYSHVVDFREMMGGLVCLPRLQCFTFGSAVRGGKGKIAAALWGSNDNLHPTDLVNLAWESFKKSAESIIVPPYELGGEPFFTDCAQFPPFFSQFRRTWFWTRGKFLCYEFQRYGNDLFVDPPPAAFAGPQRLAAPASPMEEMKGSPSGSGDVVNNSIDRKGAKAAVNSWVVLQRVKGKERHMGDDDLGKRAQILTEPNKGGWVTVRVEGATENRSWSSGYWKADEQPPARPRALFPPVNNNDGNNNNNVNNFPIINNLDPAPAPAPVAPVPGGIGSWVVLRKISSRHENDADIGKRAQILTEQKSGWVKVRVEGATKDKSWTSGHWTPA